MSFILTKFGRLWLALAMLSSMQSARAEPPKIDHLSLEGGGGSKVAMLRVGVQSAWERRFFDSNGTHVGGYWDLSLAQWRGTAYRNIPGQNQNITNIGLTPVLRLQANDRRGWYVEGGIGANLLSEKYDNDSNKLSTVFQFSDHLGIGYVFAQHWDLGLKLQHFSNGGMKKPNSGVNFVVLKLARPF